MIQLRLLNFITGETWDFYLNPSSADFTLPPGLVFPFGERYCAEIRIFTTEVCQDFKLFRTAEPMIKAYWESQC